MTTPPEPEIASASATTTTTEPPAADPAAADSAGEPSVGNRQPWAIRHRRALVIGSRTALLMLAIAGAVLLGLGVVALLRSDPQEAEGWLREIFGRVFGVVAVAMAAVIGIPSAVGLWAMSGATAPDAVPALGPLVRRVLVVVAIATVVATLVVLVATGSAVRILNLGLAGLVALAAFGLGGAASFSPHRVRAAVSGVALVLVAAGTLWILVRAFLVGPG
jgi:hypothetical protein